MTPALDIAEIRSRLAATRGRRFWASLEEIVDDQRFDRWLKAEFPAAARLMPVAGRREFLKVMAASLLLAGLGGCGESPADLAIPYVNQPEEMLPGVPRYYASAVMFEGYAQPVIATTYDGRPTKLDGNPDHPASGGKSDAFLQAAVLQLYDPDRSQTPLRDGQPATWDAFDHGLVALRARWAQSRGEGLRLVTGNVTSPTLIRQIEQWLKDYPQARVHLFEPVGAMARAEATRAAFDRIAQMHYRLERCDTIVSVGDDFLGPGPHQIVNARAWAQKRGDVAPGAGRSILHAAECTPGLTGVVATTRLAADASRLPLLITALAQRLGVGDAVPNLNDAERQWTDRAADALKQAAGHSLLMAGAAQPPQAQTLAMTINDRLGNSGNTVWYSEPIRFTPDNAGSLPDLAVDIAAGRVDTIIHLDTNPVYAAPSDIGYQALLARVPTRIHAGLYRDETARACQWHLPLTHALESWSDARAVDGVATIVQPLVNPFYSVRTVHQVMDSINGAASADAEALVRATWTQALGSDAEAKWKKSLHDGFVADTAAQPISVQTQLQAQQQTSTSTPPDANTPAAADRLDIVFAPDPAVWDGRLANIAWLQELPRPMTKITWDNVAAISPALAEHHGITNGDIVEIVVGARSIKAPAWIMPGQAPNTVTLSLGYGRRDAGRVGDTIGYDANAIRSKDSPWHATGTLKRTGDKHALATTQSHYRIDGFDLVREVTAEHPDVERKPEPPPNLYREIKYPGHAWGMSIDLDLCIGCNACVTACMAENNVPVVGKEQVAMGREMHWLRVDRYYTGEAETPRSYFQPVPCMHCEKAPCEMGCPVHATVHSSEGLNEMIYNRCIGTRTCSSYCPYKVRRFNWFDYTSTEEPGPQAVRNPDVTVRSRGVMEKCSYCIQRIAGAQVTADKENRGIREGEVVTACQQACPTTAIRFGNLNNPDADVAKKRESSRHYLLLEELGTKPRTSYLARWDDRPAAEKDGT